MKNIICSACVMILMSAVTLVEVYAMEDTTEVVHKSKKWTTAPFEMYSIENLIENAMKSAVKSEKWTATPLAGFSLCNHHSTYSDGIYFYFFKDGSGRDSRSKWETMDKHKHSDYLFRDYPYSRRSKRFDGTKWEVSEIDGHSRQPSPNCQLSEDDVFFLNKSSRRLVSFDGASWANVDIRFFLNKTEWPKVANVFRGYILSDEKGNFYVRHNRRARPGNNGFVCVGYGQPPYLVEKLMRFNEDTAAWTEIVIQIQTESGCYRVDDYACANGILYVTVYNDDETLRVYRCIPPSTPPAGSGNSSADNGSN